MEQIDKIKKVHLKIETIHTPEEWDSYVIKHEESGYCHLFNWSKIISETYNHDPVYIAAIKENSRGGRDIQGILPLFRFKPISGKPRLVSIPFFDTAGILASDNIAKLLLFNHGSVLLKKKKISGMELRQNRPLNIPDMNMEKIFPKIYRAKVGITLPISGSQQSMMAGFKSKLRSQIRKGRKNNLTWQIGKKELLSPFYNVFSHNMRDLGSPVHSKKFFDSILTHFNHHSFICVVYYCSTPVAASFMFRFKKRISNPWASSLREFRHLNSNMFLYWQMIRFACNLGMEIFDMGRSSKGASTHRFKMQWGPEESRIFWYQWNKPAKSIVHMDETLSIRPWQHLPMGMANFLGPMLRRHISL